MVPGDVFLSFIGESRLWDLSPELEYGGSLAVVGETHLEFLAGEEYAALDSSEGKVHLFGDLVVFVACNVHREGDAVFVGEFVDGVRNLVCSERTFGSFKTGVL